MKTTEEVITEKVITEKTYNGVPMSQIKIDCDNFDITEFGEKWGWGGAGDIMEILKLNGCMARRENDEEVFG